MGAAVGVTPSGAGVAAAVRGVACAARAGGREGGRGAAAAGAAARHLLAPPVEAPPAPGEVSAAALRAPHLQVWCVCCWRCFTRRK
jgi:hypothetical protein